MPGAGKWWIASFAIVIAGFVVSAYLLNRSFVLFEEADPAGSDVCSAVFGANCDDALLSDLSTQFGIPLAGWGVAYYAAFGALLLLSRVMGDGFKQEGTAAAVVLALAGAAGSVLLAGLMFSGAAPFCPLCGVVHGLNLALLVVAIALNRTVSGALLAKLTAGVRYVFGAEPSEPVMAKWRVIGLLVPALTAIVVYQWVYVQSEVRTIRVAAAAPVDAPADSLEARVETYLATPKFDIPVDETDPVYGPRDAKVQLVVFSDFECPACRRFAETAHHLLEHYGDAVSLVFKHYPLSDQCHPLMTHDMHPEACGAAYAAVAAHNQGRFWEFHDAAFELESDLTDDVILGILAALTLDKNKADLDRKSEATIAKVVKDIELGNKLGVFDYGTPSVYVNGRLVENTSLENLEFLLNLELIS